MAFNPFFFNDSPLPMELIYKALLELGDIKPTVDELKVKVDKLIADLDGAIQEEVQRVINDMYESGDFENIIDELIDNKIDSILTTALAPKEFDVDFRREFRVALWTMPYNATKKYNQYYYSFCQGSCYFKREGVEYYIGCYKPSDKNNPYYKDDDADLRLYAKIGGEWTFMRNRVYTVGHANDIRYIEHLDKFFVVYSSEYNNNVERGSYEVKVIDFELPAQYDDTFVVDYSLIVPYRDRITCIDYYDGKYWLFIGSGGDNPVQIYTFDLDEHYNISNFERYDIIYFPYTTGTAYTMICAGVCQNDEFIFIGNETPAGIYRYNKRLKRIDCFYNNGHYANMHMWPIGEMEALSIVDDIIYISTSIHGNQRVNYFDFNQVFSFDYKNNTTVGSMGVMPYGGFNRRLFVGQEGYRDNVDYYYREISNPNGLTGTYGKPFPTWEELALFIDAQEMFDTITVEPLTKNVAGYLALDLSTVNVYIDGANFYTASENLGISEEEDKYPRVSGVFVQGGGLSLRYMLVMNRVPDDELIADAYKLYQVNSWFNNLNIHRCMLYPYLRPENNKRVNFYYSFANLGLVYKGDGSQINYDEDDFDFTLSSVNMHHHWSGTGDGPDHSVIG